MTTIAIGSDHAGYTYKEAIKQHLEKIGINYIDVGTHSLDSVDYPDFAHPTATLVAKGEATWGILLCGSANGVAITANKHPEIRAAICWLPEVAALARQHNNANIICIPARFVTLDTALTMIDTFSQTPFEYGRHQSRVTKIAQY